jgi:CBS domain-containing protein
MTRSVRSLVRRPVVALAPTATLADADAALRSDGSEAVAVVRDGRLVGLVTADDLVAARPSAATTLSIGEVNGALASIPIQSIMRRDVVTRVVTSWDSSGRPICCPSWNSPSRSNQGGTRMRKLLLMVGALIVLALGSLEVIVAHNLAVTEELSARGAGSRR